MSHSCWFRSATVSLRLATFRLPRKGSMEMIAVAFGCFALASRLSRMACSSVLLGSELLKKHILAAIVGSSRRSSKHTRGISNYNNHVSNIWSVYIYIYILAAHLFRVALHPINPTMKKSPQLPTNHVDVETRVVGPSFPPCLAPQLALEFRHNVG